MITISTGDAQELKSDLLCSASGQLSFERESADTYHRLVRELKACKGGEGYVELTPELADVATRFGYLG